MKINLFIGFFAVILLIFSTLSCGEKPEDICYNDQTINLVKELAAERHLEYVLQQYRFADVLTGGLLSLAVSSNKDTYVKNIKGAIKVSDKFNAEEKRESDYYSCKISISIPENIKNPDPNKSFKYMITYQVKVDRGEKENYITVNIEEMVLLK